MTIAIELIKQLREETGAGILNCRRALEEVNEDYERALGYLRAQGLQTAVKHAERPVSQGIVELYAHGDGRVGVMVEINCETDFSARSEAFRGFAHEIALQVAASAPRYVREEDIPAEVIESESQKAAVKARDEGKAETLIPRIVNGSLKKFKDETVLLRQVYIRDDKLTIADLLGQLIASVGENIVIRRFVRWELGENE
jgi:elongation factor Ts